MTQRQALSRSSAVAPEWPELSASAASCARWIRAAAGGESATVRIAVPDASGRLRVIASEGRQDGSSRLSSSRRRAVLQTLHAVHLPVRGSVGVSLGIFPLASDGDALGVVEVLAPTATIDERMDVLLAVVGESALVLSGMHVRAETERALGLGSNMHAAQNECRLPDHRKQHVHPFVDRGCRRKHLDDAERVAVAREREDPERDADRSPDRKVNGVQCLEDCPAPAGTQPARAVLPALARDHPKSSRCVGNGDANRCGFAARRSPDPSRTRCRRGAQLGPFRRNG